MQQKFFMCGIGANKRWFYPITAFIVVSAIYVNKLWSLFIPHIQLYFGLETVATIVLATSFTGLGLIIGPPAAGYIFDKHGPKLPSALSGIIFLLGFLFVARMFRFNDWAIARYFWYSGSFLIGIGSGLFGGTYTTTIVRWFPDKTGRAMGLSVAGIGAGVIILSPVIAYFIRIIGFSAPIFVSIGLLGFIMIFVLIIPFWKVPDSNWFPEKGYVKEGHFNTDKNEKHFTLKEAVKDKRFFILFICLLTSSIATMLIIKNISMILLEGLENSYSRMYIIEIIIPFFFSLSGIVTIIGRFGWGLIVDRIGDPWKSLPYIYISSGILIVFFYCAYGSLIIFLSIGIMLYFTLAGEPTIHYAIVPYCFGRKHIGKIMSILHSLSSGIGVVLGPFIGGYIKDTTGTYFWALLLALILRIIAAVMAFYGLSIYKSPKN